MDSELLLEFVIFLLAVVIAMLSFLIYKVSEGVDRISRLVGSIELECHYEQKYSEFDDQMRPPEDE